MKFKFKEYLPEHPDCKYIGFWGALLYITFGVMFAFITDNNLFFLFAMGGVINSSFIELRIIEFHYIHRNLLVCIINIVIIIPFVLGCISADSYLFTIIGLVIGSAIIAVTSDANKIIATFGFVFSLMFVMGLNMYAPPVKAIYYGVSLAFGAFMMSLLSLIHFSIKRHHIADNNLFGHMYENFLAKLSYKKLRYFIWLALSSCSAYLIAKLTKLPNSFWAPMTVFIVLRFDINAAYKVLWHRLLGTFCGLILSVPIVFYIHKSIILIVIIPILMFFVLLTSVGKYYGIYVCFITMLIIAGFQCLKKTGIESMESRFTATLISIIISAVAIYVIAPFSIKYFSKSK